MSALWTGTRDHDTWTKRSTPADVRRAAWSAWLALLALALSPAVAHGTTVSRRKAANLTNIYAYEIWNEPNGTWTSTSIAFNDFWRQTFVQLRQIDPTIKITGPSISYYNQSYLQSFLSYCKTNSCLPDIV